MHKKCTHAHTAHGRAWGRTGPRVAVDGLARPCPRPRPAPRVGQATRAQKRGGGRRHGDANREPRGAVRRPSRGPGEPRARVAQLQADAGRRGERGRGGEEGRWNGGGGARGRGFSPRQSAEGARTRKKGTGAGARGWFASCDARVGIIRPGPVIWPSVSVICHPRAPRPVCFAAGWGEAVDVRTSRLPRRGCARASIHLLSILALRERRPRQGR